MRPTRAHTLRTPWPRESTSLPPPPPFHSPPSSVRHPTPDPASPPGVRSGLRARRQRARDVYQKGDLGAKKEAVEMLREGKAADGSARGEPSPQVEACC